MNFQYVLMNVHSDICSWPGAPVVNALFPQRQALTNVLRACLVWYTTSKFTPSNQSFIDSTPWDDANCEFDPRVFQAYVWRTAPP